MSSALIDDGSRAMQQTVEIHESNLYTQHLQHENVEAFDDFYQIKQTVDLILEHKFRRVALQFPDCLLQDAATVSYRIQHYFNSMKPTATTATTVDTTENSNTSDTSDAATATATTKMTIGDIEDVGSFETSYIPDFHTSYPPKQLSNNDQLGIYILGDTSYGSCCVDEVGAQHSDSDFIVHYGNACLQKVKRSPVQHVFGRNYLLNVQDCFTSLSEFASSNADTTVVVLFDLINTYGVSQLKDMYNKATQNGQLLTSNIVFGELNQERVIQNMPVVTDSSDQKELLEENNNNNNNTITNEDDSGSIMYYEANGLKFSVPSERKDSFKFFFVGEDSVQLTQIMMDFNSHQFARFSPSDNAFDDGYSASSRTARMLKRRYYLVQLAKEAQVIGIVVATVSVENYLKVLAYVKSLITETGKKYYVFFVGKLNVPKMANFAEVDLFCLISCAQNSLIDSKEFLKPIVTPFELELALKEGKDWTTEYISDFNRLLQRNRLEAPKMNTEDQAKNEQTDGEDDDEYEYSFITGSMRRNKRSTASSANMTDADGMKGQLVHVDPSQQQLLLSEMTPSMLFLQTRTYQGLDQSIGETPIATMQEGRSGIAMNYTHEDENNSSS